MAKVDSLLKEEILEGVISQYSDKEIETREYLVEMIPTLYTNRLRNMRASRKPALLPVWETKLSEKVARRKLKIWETKL